HSRKGNRHRMNATLKSSSSSLASCCPPCYPACPINGGPLPKALPKSNGPGGSPWTLEGKYNGWRAWVHQPTHRMFNRKNEPLSITNEFEIALDELCQLPFEWLDVEALERRHKIGRGSLILLDAPDAGITYTERKACLNLVAG